MLSLRPEVLILLGALDEPKAYLLLPPVVKDHDAFAVDDADHLAGIGGGSRRRHPIGKGNLYFPLGTGTIRALAAPGQGKRAIVEGTLDPRSNEKARRSQPRAGEFNSLILPHTARSCPPRYS